MTGSQWYNQAKWKVFKREAVANAYGEDTIIRFVEMTDASHLEDAVSYIDSLATFTDPVVNGKAVSGTWVTKSIWYEEGRPYGKAETLRLYHAMCPQGSSTGDGLYVTEDGCTYKVTYTFFWRQASLMNPVTPGTSGIEYSIKGQTKDPVTGFWNFVLEKREQFTTWTGIVTAADDIFKTVTEQTFLGVRTGNVLAFKAGAEAGTLWTAGNPTAGTLIENVSVSKNDNCTTNVTQRKTVAKTGTGGAGIALDRMKTIQGLETTVDENTASRTTAEPEETTQTAGTAVTVKNNYRADGLIDVRKIVETGEKYTDSYTVPDEDGDVTVTRYFNHTAAEEKALLAALSATRSNQASPGQVNKFRKFDGVIVSRPPRRGSSAHNRTPVDETGKTYTRVELIHRDGVEYARTWTYTYNVKQDWGISSGYSAYNGAKAGSSFQLIGDDWYKYEKVTDIKVSEVVVTITGTPQSI